MAIPVIPCGVCGEYATIYYGTRVYPHRRDLWNKHFWVCSCGARVGCHPGTREPLGTPADEDLRILRQKAHKALDGIWKKKLMSRKTVYAWLAQRMELSKAECHIGKFNKERCAICISLAESYKKGHVKN